MCVKECPNENEVGVRDFPVCVDEVDPNMYTNVIDNPDLIPVRNMYHG